jgi:hypothetical protein
MTVFRYGEPRRIYTRNSSFVSDVSKSVCRIPSGHPEGFLEAFANLYVGVAEAITSQIDGKPLSMEEYNFPTVVDGVRGMDFVETAVESSKKGAVWMPLPSE